MNPWSPIPQLPNYFISTLGNIFNANTNNFIKPEIKNGYPRLIIKRKEKTVRLTVHRLVALAFIPNPENKPQINHKNGIKTDFRVDNLEWCTPQENTDHAILTGLLFTEKRIQSYQKRKVIHPEWLKYNNKTNLPGKDHARSIPVYLFDNNKQFVRSYESQNLCAIDLKCGHGSVWRAIHKGCKSKGYYISTNKNKFSA